MFCALNKTNLNYFSRNKLVETHRAVKNLIDERETSNLKLLSRSFVGFRRDLRDLIRVGTFSSTLESYINTPLSFSLFRTLRSCFFAKYAHLARRSRCQTAMSRDVGLWPVQWLLYDGQGSIRVSRNTGFGVARWTAVLLTTPSPQLFFRLALTYACTGPSYARLRSLHLITVCVRKR